MNWLSSHLSCLTLSEDHEGYFLGRGAKEDAIREYGVKTWRACRTSDAVFEERYGDGGSYLDGWVVWPLYSPRGVVIGFEGRRIQEKRVTRYLMPEAEWQPVWFGLTPRVMQRIWEGCDIWIVEGLFDLFALQWVIPDGDVVLASLRAKLTDKHIEFLRRFCQGWVRMVYDNDEAGYHGVHGFIDKRGKQRWGALHHLDRVHVKAMHVTYRGKDPGEIWNQGGIAGMRATFAHQL